MFEPEMEVLGYKALRHYPNFVTALEGRGFSPAIPVRKRSLEDRALGPEARADDRLWLQGLKPQFKAGR